jgi:hypothetical protein
MTSLLVGYAQVSTDQQDLTSQREGLAALGVAPNRIYVDHGLTGTNRERPDLRVRPWRLVERATRWLSPSSIGWRGLFRMSGRSPTNSRFDR